MVHETVAGQHTHNCVIMLLGFNTEQICFKTQVQKQAYATAMAAARMGPRGPCWIVPTTSSPATRLAGLELIRSALSRSPVKVTHVERTQTLVCDRQHKNYSSTINSPTKTQPSTPARPACTSAKLAPIFSTHPSTNTPIQHTSRQPNCQPNCNQQPALCYRLLAANPTPLRQLLVLVSEAAIDL